MVHCLLSRPSTIADLNRCSARALANSVARCVGQPNCRLSLLSCLFAEWIQSVSLKFLWQRQQFARVPGSSRPLYEIPVLLKFCNFPEPRRPLFVGNSHHIRKVTRSQAAADRQLNPLQQPSGTPLLFQVHRNQRRPFSVFPRQQPWQTVRCPITSRFVARGCVESADVRLKSCATAGDWENRPRTHPRDEEIGGSSRAEFRVKAISEETWMNAAR